jgi:hypothetical protein
LAGHDHLDERPLQQRVELVRHRELDAVLPLLLHPTSLATLKVVAVVIGHVVGVVAAHDRAIHLVSLVQWARTALVLCEPSPLADKPSRIQTRDKELRTSHNRLTTDSPKVASGPCLYTYKTSGTYATFFVIGSPVGRSEFHISKAIDGC